MNTDELIIELAEYSDDPLGFVLFAFPWGEFDGELANAEGPEPWQIDLLTQLRDGLIDYHQAIQLARTSGHGIGKSALVAWIILWAISTLEDTKGVVTANTENQLKTKTWAELAKWYRLFIGRGLFSMTATAIFSRDPEHERTWRIDMVPWSERNTEAFAGLHNLGKRLLVVFDEGSAIPDVIYEVTEGALTDASTQIIWTIFGNPTRNKGRFRECFPGGQFAHRWKTAAIDSRSVSFTNKEQLERWVQDYGEDHDFVRIRVRGVFPRIDAESFIGLELARSAVDRAIEPQLGHPLVLGVDVGRFGDDPSVIYARKGRDAHSNPPQVYPYIDTVALTDAIVKTFHHLNANMVFVDEGGIGGGVVDQLRRRKIPVRGVDFGAGADGTNEIEQGVKYANKRAEIWGAMRDWLPEGSIVSVVSGVEEDLPTELSNPSFGMNVREQILLESKKDMRRRQVKSPNVADALACTFAYPVYTPREIDIHRTPVEISPDYNPFELERIYSNVS